VVRLEIIHLEHPFRQSQLSESESCVMALGFFDGIHLGHQRIIQTAKEAARESNKKLAVMTFFPHPREVINKSETPVSCLSPLLVKQDNFAKMGVEKLFIVKFDIDFSRLLPNDFINQYIIGLNCSHVVAGFDFTFGYKGEGNMNQLKEDALGRFEVTTISKVEHNNQKISSTIIRNLVSSGNVGLIPDYLGSFYEVSGKIKTYPVSLKATYYIIRIFIDKGYVLPKAGVYKIQAQIENRNYDVICRQDLYENNNQDYFDVQLFECTENIDEKIVKVKWVDNKNFYCPDMWDRSM
jgi:riboflavin kinase/FMN adenylyltransferase